jgi:hypothetical protein
MRARLIDDTAFAFVSAAVATVRQAKLEEEPQLLRWRVPLAAVALDRELGSGGACCGQAGLGCTHCTSESPSHLRPSVSGHIRHSASPASAC